MIAADHDDYPVFVHIGLLCVILEVVMMMLILSLMVMIHCHCAFVVVSCPDDAMTSLLFWDSSKRVDYTCLTTFLPKFLHWETEQIPDYVDDDP